MLKEKQEIEHLSQIKLSEPVKIIIIIIRHQFGLDRPASASSVTVSS